MNIVRFSTLLFAACIGIGFRAITTGANKEGAPANPANARIIVGDSSIDGSPLIPYDNVWLYAVTRQDGKVVPQGLWSDHLQKTTVEGKPAFLRVQGLTFVTGATSSTVNIFEPKTLRPYSSRQQGAKGEVLSRKFNDKHVSTTRTDNSGTSKPSSEVDLPAVPFDFNGGMYGLLLAMLPLREGYEASFDTIEESEDKASIDFVKVLGKEDVVAGMRGHVNAWKVESERPAAYRMIFWLLKEPPYVIKLQYTRTDSPLVWTWTMI